MTTPDQIPGKHLVCGKISDEALESLKQLSSVIAVVLHVTGKKKGEHPHWHVWLDVVGITHEAVRKRLRTHNELWRSYSGNEHWSLRDHTSYSTWSTYVTSNPSAQILFERPTDKFPPIPPVVPIPIVASAASAASVASSPLTIIKPPKKSLPMRTQFVQYLTNKGWSPECITIGYMADKKEELISELTDYWENAFTTPQGAVMIQHAMYVFGDTVVRNRIKECNSAALNSLLRF